jgi:DNA-binding XRE family transcriptional regulator
MRNMSVSALAKAVGIGQPHMTLIEKGKRQPSDEVAVKIAQVLGIVDLRAIERNPGDVELDVPEPERYVA